MLEYLKQFEILQIITFCLAVTFLLVIVFTRRFNLLFEALPLTAFAIAASPHMPLIGILLWSINIALVIMEHLEKKGDLKRNDYEPDI